VRVKIEVTPKVFKPFKIEVWIDNERDLSDLLEALNHMPIHSARKFHDEINASETLK
jgi:hypothetical protein